MSRAKLCDSMVGWDAPPFALSGAELANELAGGSSNSAPRSQPCSWVAVACLCMEGADAPLLGSRWQTQGSCRVSVRELQRLERAQKQGKGPRSGGPQVPMNSVSFEM